MVVVLEAGLEVLEGRDESFSVVLVALGGSLAEGMECDIAPGRVPPSWVAARPQVGALPQAGVRRQEAALQLAAVQPQAAVRQREVA